MGEKKMTWGELMEFIQENPDLHDKEATIFDMNTDKLYYADFIEFVEDGDILPNGYVAIVGLRW